DYIYDDGEADYGWRYNAGYEGWMGNYFPISSSGMILSIEMFFSFAEGHGNNDLTVDIFDDNRNLIGSTYPFTPGTDSWILIDGESIQYAGAIYVMVHWDFVVEPTNYLGMDQNGPNAYMDLGYYCDGTLNWGKTSSLASGNGDPGVFLMRLQVQLTSGKIITYTSRMDPVMNEIMIEDPAGIEAIERKKQ
ncbi:MAG: hypothetical protein HQ542_11980, partial [Bacteroidia bacterium]|nr:hypothetical protein [Bacteroidia bacterium]